MLHSHRDHAHRVALVDSPLSYLPEVIGPFGGDLRRAHRTGPHRPTRRDTREPSTTIARSTQADLTARSPRRPAAAGHPLQPGQLPQLTAQLVPASTRHRPLRRSLAVVIT